MAQETTYRYGPLERGGVMLGLRVPQLVGFVVAGMIGLGFLNQANFIGLLLAVGTIAVTAGILLVPIRGHTIEEWAPLTIRFSSGGCRARRASARSSPRSGTSCACPRAALSPRGPRSPGRCRPSWPGWSSSRASWHA